MRVAGIHRRASLSPGNHRYNDAAILDETMARLVRLGWQEAPGTTEERIESGEPLPEADLYLNMCQGPEASTRLLALERPGGGLLLNHPSSVLSCHRAALVTRLEGTDVPFASSRIVRPDDLGEHRLWLEGATDRLWIKRGDVHAEGPADVCSAAPADVRPTLDGFFRRGIRSVVLQRHVEGPLVKFYGIGEGGWFRWYMDAPSARARFDEERLRDAAFSAAARLGVEIFGGDAVIVESGEPVLIDVNDWPSFARCRADAAEAIAGYVCDRLRAHAAGRDASAAVGAGTDA